MRCEDVQDRLPEYVSGSLPDDERLRVDAHLGSGCRRCLSECEAIGQAVVLLAESLTPAAPRPGLRRQVLEAIDRDLGAPAPTIPAPPANERRGWAGYFPSIAITLCAVAVGVMASRFIGPESDGHPEIAAPATNPDAEDAGVAQWRRRVAAAEREFGPPRAQLTGMPTTSNDPALQAVVFYDPLAKQVHVLVSGVAAGDADHTLWAWFRDGSDQVLFGGALESVGAAQSTGVIDADSDPALVRGVLLTDEPAGSHDAPSGPVVGRAVFAPRPLTPSR